MNSKVEKLKESIPELRFPGFGGEWEEKRLGEVGRILTGKTPSTTNKTLWGGDVLFVTPTDITNGEKYQRQTARKVEVGDFKKILPSGSILYTCIASIGKMSLSTAPSISNQQINALITDGKSDNEFVYYALLNETPRIKAIQANTTLPIINKTEFSRIKIGMPVLDEQQKIAGFLTEVDKWIENLKSQKQKWEEYKKWMMQKIFSQEIRFKDEDGNEFPDWEEKRLGEVAKVLGGGTPDTTVKDFWGGDIVWFTPTEIKHKYLSESERTITSEGVTKSSATILPVGTILLTTRATIGDVGIATVECTTNQGFQSFIVHNDQENEFWYYWLIQNRKEFFRRANGSTFSEISGTEIRKIKTLVPSLREQQKIAGFLTAVDEVIHSHQQKIAQAEEWKKGLMQRMFV